MDQFEIPQDNHHYAGIGQNGSGKSIGAWHVLSYRSYDRQPWIIVDPKRDDHIAEAQAALDLREFGFGDDIPRDPGLHIIRPYPHECERDGPLEEMFWRILDIGGTGVFVDEALVIGKNNRGYRTLLTQGRSKKIPIMSLTQRPVDVDRFAFSEAKYIQAYFLSDVRDHKTVRGFAPIDFSEPLPEFWSHYYKSGERQPVRVPPVPPLAVSLERIRRRMGRPAPAGDDVDKIPAVEMF